MLTSFIFVPVAGLEPARLGSSIELHGRRFCNAGSANLDRQFRDMLRSHESA